MFTLPIACLLLMVPGQAGTYENIRDPGILISLSEKAIIERDQNAISKLIPTLKLAWADAQNDNQKSRLVFVLGNLQAWDAYLNNSKSLALYLNPDVDPDLTLVGGFVILSALAGKDAFLDFRGQLENQLKKSFKSNPVNNSQEFLLRKALKDMDRLAQLAKDPSRRPEIDKFFLLFKDNPARADIPQDEEKQTGYLKYRRDVSNRAINLFGKGSFFHCQALPPILLILENECRRGKMQGVDLSVEIEKEFTGFLESDWSDNYFIKDWYLNALANACLSGKTKNHVKLMHLIDDMENHCKLMSTTESSDFLYPASYRMVMLVQQGRHAECIREFEKIKLSKIESSHSNLTKIDFYLCAAQSYGVLGKKDLALLNQEMAFDAALQIPERQVFLVEFRKSVAKDLRDKYAQNNRMKDARNLEERCQLLGLGFEPLPKQAGE